MITLHVRRDHLLIRIHIDIVAGVRVHTRVVAVARHILIRLVLLHRLLLMLLRILHMLLMRFQLHLLRFQSLNLGL